jgi:phenylacetate-CoA oxygenase PaaI subunit
MNSMLDTSVHNAELIALLAALADNKCWLGRRYAEWCTAAPTLESAVAAAAMAQDEIGHARSFYPVLRDLAGASEQTDPETRTMWTNAPFLNASFSSWTDFVAANFLFDTALTVLLEFASDSTFPPLAQRARRILEEEPLHWLHGEGWTHRLAARGESVRAAMETSFAVVAPQACELFLLATPGLTASAVLAADEALLVTAYRHRVAPVLLEAGLAPL